MAMFDSIMKDHLTVERGTTSHNSYQGHHVQNELIDLLSSKIISAIVDDIKQAKFCFNNSGLHPRYKPHRTLLMILHRGSPKRSGFSLCFLFLVQ